MLMIGMRWFRGFGQLEFIPFSSFQTYLPGLAWMEPCDDVHDNSPALVSSAHGAFHCLEVTFPWYLVQQGTLSAM